MTHRSPAALADAVELPSGTKRRIGLDGERSWAVVSDLNDFIWPGHDLRPIPGRDGAYAYGVIPAKLLDRIKAAILLSARGGAARITKR